MKTIGITGTRHGATEAQLETLRRFLDKGKAAGWTHMVHGACTGVDTQAHTAGEIRGFTFNLRPGSISQRRAFSDTVHKGNTHIHAVEPYLERNLKIVEDADVLIAMPNGYKERHSGGTWHTVRAARAAGVPVRIIWPDGAVVGYHSDGSCQTLNNH